MADVVDLRPDQFSTVQTILAAHLPNAGVWAFGSRAKWTAKDTSDLDLALVSEKPIPSATLDRLRRAFEESYLPVKVDVVDFARVSEEFRNVIRKQKVVLRSATSLNGPAARASEWRSLPLEECVETIIDYRGKTPRKVSSGIPLITAKVIKGGRIETPDEFIAPEDYAGWMRRGIPRAGDVLLTMEAPLGEVAQLDDRKVALAQRLVALRGKSGLLDNDFLKYLLQSKLIQDQLRSRASGTTVLGIKQSELRKITLIFPPLPEQKAIAAVLGALDDKIELNRRMNATLEAIARALFQSWFVDFDPVRAKLDGRQPLGLDPATAVLFPAHFEHTEDGLMPLGWRRAAIEEVCEINAWTLARNDHLKTLEYVEISEVSRGNIANIATHTRGEEPSRARRRLRHGDTVLSTVRPDRGSYFLALNPPDNRVASTGFAVLTPTKVPWSFVHAAMTQPEVSDHLGQMADGGAYPAVRPEVIGAMQVALPNEPKILEAFHRICAPLLEQAEANRTQSRTIAIVRDALLPKLLSGEIVFTPHEA